MKKISSVLLILLSMQAIAFSQVTCKFETSESDKSTGEKTIITDSTIGFFGYSGMYLKAIKTGDQYSIYATVNFPANTANPAYSIVKGQELTFFLANNDSIILNAVETKTGFTKERSHSLTSIFDAFVYDTFSISAAQLKRLLASPLASINIDVTFPDNSKGNFEYDVHRKAPNVLINIFTCLSNG